MEIRIDDPLQTDIYALLQEHLQDMALHSPAESVHALDPQALSAADMTFWAAWCGQDHTLMGCGALKQLDAGHGEIKSMRTREGFQGQGVASAILRELLDESHRRCYARLSLETGSAAAFLPARKLYESHGFSYCEPFASYQPDPHSVFMTLQLGCSG